MNNDGYIDLIETNCIASEKNYLYENNPGMKFRRVENEPFVSPGINARSISSCDYDNDGDMDVFITSFSAS